MLFAALVLAPIPPNTDALIKLVPTLVAGLALWVCMTRAESPWALPLTLGAVPAAFHLYLLATHTTLAQAQDAGWVLKPEVGNKYVLASPDKTAHMLQLRGVIFMFLMHCFLWIRL